MPKALGALGPQLTYVRPSPFCLPVELQLATWPHSDAEPSDLRSGQAFSLPERMRTYVRTDVRSSDWL